MTQISLKAAKQSAAIVGALLLAPVVIATGGALASHATATINGEVNPAKLPADRRVAATLSVGAEVSADPGKEFEPVDQIKLDAGRNLKVNLGAVPRCSADLTDTTAAEAEAACGPSRVSVDPASSAVIDLSGPGGNFSTTLPLKIFNGPGNSQVRVWIRSDPLDRTFVLTAAVSQAPEAPLARAASRGAERKWGPRLTLPAPQFDDGTLGPYSLRGIHLGVKVDKGRFVTANCEAANQRFRAIVTYKSVHPADIVTDSDPCRRR